MPTVTAEGRLKDLLKAIFNVQNVRFDLPSDSKEQETLFVQVENYLPRLRDGVECARVSGRAFIFANSDKMPAGYLSKCIIQNGELAKQFFFGDLEESQPIYKNIVQRGFSFVYFFNSQYDPNLGTINQITIEVTT